MTGRSRRSRTACATEDQSPINTKTKKTKNQRTTAEARRFTPQQVEHHFQGPRPGSGGQGRVRPYVR